MRRIHYTIANGQRSHRRADAAGTAPADPFERPDEGRGGILGLLKNANPVTNVGTFSMLRDAEPTPTVTRPALPPLATAAVLLILLALALFTR